MNYDILMALSEWMLSSSWLRYILVNLYLQFLGLTELIVTHVEINYLLIFFLMFSGNVMKKSLHFWVWMNWVQILIFSPLISSVGRLLRLSGLHLPHLCNKSDKLNQIGLNEIMCGQWLVLSSFLINIHLSPSHSCVFFPFFFSLPLKSIATET